MRTTLSEKSVRGDPKLVLHELWVLFGELNSVFVFAVGKYALMEELLPVIGEHSSTLELREG
jgi:hypothetical protein